MGARSRRKPAAKRASLKTKTVTPEAPTPVSPPRIDEGPGADGNIDIWPILAAGAAALAKEIGKGEHDDYLSFLAACDRSQHDGGRPLVQEAVRKRKGL